MGHGGDVIAELTTDHGEVEEMFGRIAGLPVGDPRRKRYVDQVTIELVRHSVAEEAYLYPAVREHVPDGDALADRELADHAEAERTLKALERCAANDPDFDLLVGRLTTEIRAHIQDEETRLFPLLRASCSAEALDGLGEKVRAAKRTAPTRPHPAAPGTPPADKLLAPGLGLVDRLRDTLTGRGSKDT
ncbi:hemerythrin domain-containing protein [Streptomyces phaeolivaceus]|uniref:Hemerythrin domain-containing protein n=1 Tax=Streptomyces phaeolivaceus TaxID=2653200 RepID=A0A5P8JYJ8_9ACTN|nr:hemerythrin domain-containing protein [Streptomyces phaeolivaceus]QFQ95568.1 hemerythrin domain-containing protein [Streptomyces phaeolivaceus]